MFLDEATGRIDPAIDVHCSYEGLERIRQESFSVPAAVPFFPSTKQQVIAKAQVGCAAM
jgi:hypothetical protein